MRYYVGIDLMYGYAGFKNCEARYTPNIVSSIDYTQEDKTTESGFAKHMWLSVQYMEKVKQPNFRKG